jgi:probable HAF family extracellular repeat protein
MKLRVCHLAMLWWALLAAALPLPGRTEPLYRVTVVGPANSVAVDINRTGQMVGNLEDGSASSRAFFHDGTTVQDLGTLPGAGYSMAGGLNDSGTVVGTAGPSGQFQLRHGFVYANGVLANISSAPASMATHINNAGTAVGMAFITNNYDPEGSLANHAVTFFNGWSVDLTNAIGFPNMVSEANAINEAGHAVGTVHEDYNFGVPVAFMYRDGVTTYLGMGENWYGVASAINNHDQVAGHVYGVLEDGTADLTRMHAAIYDDGAARDLGAMIEGGNSAAWDINDEGHVVGWTDTMAGVRAFLYVNGEMVLLDSLIDPASGWTIQDARAINVDDQIAATACKAGICQAVRLDPLTAVPEPAQWGMSGAGVLFLLGQRAAGAGQNRIVKISQRLSESVKKIPAQGGKH